MNREMVIIRKSIGAAFLISLGNYALLKLGNPIGPIIFAFGLLGVCYLGQDLFTGKCGFLFEDNIKISDLLLILVINLVAGLIFGLIYSITDPEIYKAAVDKVATWDFSLAFFIKAFLCGTIMYIAVAMYRKGTSLGIIFGIPLFIFCGFQHCIANIATIGTARTWDWSIILAIIGNFVGSLFMWYIAKDEEKEGKSKLWKKVKSIFQKK